MVAIGGFDAGSWADLLWRGINVRITAASHGIWTNIHGETLALSCETKNISAIYVPACRCAYTWSHKSQYFSFLGRAANVSRWNIRPCCLGAGVGRVGLSSQGGEYRSGSKNGGYFGKRAADARQTSPRNTEVGARMASASVNEVFFHIKQVRRSKKPCFCGPIPYQKISIAFK